jgi:hypothetical protein
MPMKAPNGERVYLNDKGIIVAFGGGADGLPRKHRA